MIHGTVYLKKGSFTKRFSITPKIKKVCPHLFGNNDFSSFDKEDNSASFLIGFEDIDYKILKINVKLLKMFSFQKNSVTETVFQNEQELYTQLHLSVLEKHFHKEMLDNI